MAGYKYNPLLKLNLQEDAEVSPSDIQHLQEEIDAANENITSIEGDLKNKVPKFFVSIEELEVGEIGQYQGEPGGDFVPGYFYKRQDGGEVPIMGEPITSEEILKRGRGFDDDDKGPYLYLLNGTSLTSAAVTIDGTYSLIRLKNNNDPNSRQYWVLFIPSALSLQGTNIAVGQITAASTLGGTLYPYCTPDDDKTALYELRVNSNVLECYDTTLEAWVTLDSWSGYGEIQNNAIFSGAFYYPFNNKLAACRYFITNWGGVIIPQNATKAEQLIWYPAQLWPTSASSYVPFVANAELYTITGWQTVSDFVRVDAQPSLDPSTFATAAQGAKADTALQSINKGTDGNYITTTVTAKDANNQQKVSASLTIQAMSGADSAHKGVAEASDIKEYIQNNTATPQQGTNADNALQTIESGTSSDYVSVTVTPKQTNKQRVGVTLTIQDINTASESAKGLLEAWNARNYIDTQVYNVSLNFFFYGVQWDENDPSPDCTRIGNMGLHAELPIQNAIIGGLLADDLTFTPFADQSDWSGETVDGSAGQIMVQIPKYYFKSELHGTIHKKLISQYPLAGFNEIPLMYISAEKATVDRTDPNTPKLCSVVNTTAAFRGGNNTADWDGTYRSLLGFPATNISLTQFRQYARNRAAGTAWNCAAYHAQRSLYWLFVTEYATLNSQKPYNAAKDVNGYMQGGLGPGASNWNGDAWNAYNGYNPLIPCGYMLEYGNRSAVKNYSVKDANSNVLVTFEVNSFHGIQSPFADTWDWFDGILINVQSDAEGGISTCYVTDEPAKFSSTDFSQYRELGSVPRADSWIKAIYDGEAGDIICKTQGGSSTAYYCDYYWGENLPASGVSLRGVRFGGLANYGAHCGFLYATSNDVPGDVRPYIGSRLCTFPSP